MTRHSIREDDAHWGVLLVEDDRIHQRWISTLLQKEGYAVYIASNSQEALEALENNREKLQLILMDVQLGETDGLETTAAIRARERETGIHLPMIAMTAHSMVGDRERCLAAGMDDFVSQPIRSEELLAAVHRLLSGDHAPMAAQVPALDVSVALQQMGGDKELLAQLASLFSQEAPQLMAAIRDAVERRDAEALERAAHMLKGAVGNFAARQVFDAALKLQTMGRNRDLSEAQEVCCSLEQSLERLKPELARLAE